MVNEYYVARDQNGEEREFSECDQAVACAKGWKQDRLNDGVAVDDIQILVLVVSEEVILWDEEAST